MHRAPPKSIHHVLWDLDTDALDVEADADSIIPRVLEHGGQADVVALIELYGLERIHRFFRDVGHPIVSDRTRKFWRAFFRAGAETWSTVPSWSRSNAAPWID